MRVRPADPKDASEVVRLAAMVFASMGLSSASEPAWRQDGERHVRERLGEDLAIFVIDHPDKPGHLVASAAGTIAQRLPTPVNREGRAGYVQWVCTDPEFRNHGLASQVMTALISWFGHHGVGTIELHATPMAERLYLKLGFDDSGPRALRRRSW